MAEPDPWAQFPTTQNAATLPNGGVYVPPTMTPQQQAEEKRKQEDQARQAEQLRLAQEAAARSAAAEQRAQAEFEGTAGKPTESDKTAAAFLIRALGANRAYEDTGMGARNIFAQAFQDSSPNLANTIINADPRQVANSAQDEFIAASLRQDSGAAIPEEEMERQRRIYFPMPGDGAEAIEQKRQARIRAIEGLRLAAGPLRTEAEERFAALEAQFADKPSALDPTRQTPTDPTISGAAGAYMTPRDKELQDKLRAAYSAGAPLTELQAIAAEYGKPAGLPATQQELDAARREGRRINVLPSGFREEDVSALGISPESTGGAYAMSAANALLAGGLDEIVGALGGDPALAQAAKEQMRERYPVASFTGEVTGQALQLAAGGAALRGLGAGAKTLIGAEAAQGAAYGAGESNENRLLGAGVGAGGALAGRAIADRFVEPGVQAIFQRISRDTGVPVEEVQRVAAEALETSTTEATEAVAEPISDEVTRLARQAASVGPRSRTARRKLAEIAAVDPEAAAAAQRLGVDLPPDVLSENVQLRNLTGLARSQVGSEAETGWQSTAGRAALRVQNVLEEVGATNDVGQLSEDVSARITRSMNDLEAQADALRKDVVAAIDVRERVDATNLQEVLAGTINDLGGIDEAKRVMSKEERKLLAALGEGDTAAQPTYAYLERIRDEIGRAIHQKQGPWTDTPLANLKRYYAALAQDRVDFVRQVGGDELAEKLVSSNALFSQMYAAREELVSLFGDDLMGGIVPKLRTALTTGGKGDIAGLNRILARIPEDMQGEVLLSGIMAESMSKTGADGGFSFANFSKLYRGLQNNKPIIAKIGRAIGPERMAIMTDLYAVGRRIADAESRILRTGKANQAQLATLNADSFVSSFLKQWGTRAAGAGVGAATGTGPLGMATGATVGEVLTRLFTSGTSRTDRLHNVLSSPQFRDTVERVAAGDTSPGVLNKLANSNAFVAFARATGLDTPEARMAWLKRIATGAGTAGATAAGAETEPQPRIELVP